MKIISFVIAIVLSGIYSQAQVTTHLINVTSQDDFNSLNERINQLLSNSEKVDINVVFSQGVYTFYEDHLNLKDIEEPFSSLHFEGNGSIIMAEGEDYYNGDVFEDDATPAESFITTDGLDLNTWSKVLRTSNNLVEVVDEGSNLCRLNASDLGHLKDKNENECRWMYIWIPQWYYSSSYKVIKIESGYIYFKSSSSLINGDYSYGKTSKLRFRLSNNPDERGDVLITDGHVYFPNGIGKVRHAKASRLLNSYNSKFKSISIKDLKFYGNGKTDNSIESPNLNKQLIDLRYTKCDDISIEHCDFRSLQVAAINVSSTNNVSIKNCSFENCYTYCIYQDRSSSLIDIHNCEFHNVNKRINLSKAILCSGADFHVYDNIFSDFGYCAIGAGIWEGGPDITLNCNGVIERNEIYYTQPYFENADDHNIMDSGAIYLYTISNSTIVRYNYIHHYGGAGDNRGIFCDDGAKNVQIYCNTITNVANSHCIESRRVVINNRRLGELNINNIIRDNIVDGTILFEGNEMKNNGCRYEGNIHLDGNYSNDIISNVNQ